MSDPHNTLIRAGDLRLNTFEWGSPANPPLILLHGLASTSHMFDLIAPQFARDYHIIAFDQRGHGLSDKPDTGYDFETIASDLDNLLAAMGLSDVPITLAGHSWGAATTVYYTATRPQRVQKAILIDGGLRPMTDFFKSLDDMAPPPRHNQTLANIKRMIRENWLGAAYRPELEPLALSIYNVTNPDDVQPHLKLANHMQIASALWNYSASDYFPRIQSPLLAVLGIGVGESLDPRTQAYAEAARASLKQFEVVWMPDTIHDIPWHRPNELVSVMRRFLKT